MSSRLAESASFASPSLVRYPSVSPAAASSALSSTSTTASSNDLTIASNSSASSAGGSSAAKLAYSSRRISAASPIGPAASSADGVSLPVGNSAEKSGVVSSTAF